jgi:hypothetical protein
MQYIFLKGSRSGSNTRVTAVDIPLCLFLRGWFGFHLLATVKICLPVGLVSRAPWKRVVMPLNRSHSTCKFQVVSEELCPIGQSVYHTVSPCNVSDVATPKLSARLGLRVGRPWNPSSIAGKGKRLFSSPQHSCQLWDQASLQFVAYQRFFP